MCIGIPVQVVSSFGSYAQCRGADGRSVEVDMLLVGEQPRGTWLLCFLNTAREVISERRAQETHDALQALNGALRGDNVDHLFADLVDREPQLPDFLRPPPSPSTEDA